MKHKAAQHKAAQLKHYDSILCHDRINTHIVLGYPDIIVRPIACIHVAIAIIK